MRGIDVSDKDEMRDARLRFCEKALGLRRTLKSMSSLTGAQLGRVLDEMRRLERSPTLPGAEYRVPALAGSFAREKSPTEVGTLNTAGAEIHHLATDAQVGAIQKLFHYLQWSAIGAQAFMSEKFGRGSERLLSPVQANSLTMILFNIAGAKAIKSRPGFEGKVSRQMIRMEIPRLKRELGIDQKPASNLMDYREDDFNE